jgi:PIN domain nuclease of toxin-antitoxin system
MSLLLDTHVWVWGVASPTRLSAKVRSAIERRRGDLWLSPISLWELGMLADRGRVAIDGAFDSWVARALQESPVREAPLTNEIALAARSVTLSHGDPVDRLLAATARVLDLTLVTADERLISGQGFKVLANR